MKRKSIAIFASYSVEHVLLQKLYHPTTTPMPTPMPTPMRTPTQAKTFLSAHEFLVTFLEIEVQLFSSKVFFFFKDDFFSSRRFLHCLELLEVLHLELVRRLNDLGVAVVDVDVAGTNARAAVKKM